LIFKIWLKKEVLIPKMAKD